jgi:hypothetical protein
VYRVPFRIFYCWSCSLSVSLDITSLNILEHKSEVEHIIAEDTDPQNGFVLLPDFKWDKKDVSRLYLLGAPQTILALHVPD